MTDLDQARLLGETMIGIGQAHGVRTAAMLTAMDTPLGRAVGNAIEVAEALDVLSGGGPDDVRDLSVAEAEAMLRLAGLDGDPAKALADGRALDKFREMIRAQGGDPDQPLPDSPVLGTVTAWRDGIVRRLDALGGRDGLLAPGSRAVAARRIGVGGSRA